MLEANKDKIEVKPVIKVDAELTNNISELIRDHAAKSILNIFNDLHHADIAEIINHLSHENATYAFNLLNTETAGEVITELDENLRERILKFIDPVKITEIVDALDSDDATDIISDLPNEVAEHVLENIDEISSEGVKELLKYDEESAGGIMNSDFVFVNENADIKDAIKEVRNNAAEFDQIYHIYVLSRENKLVGVVSLKSLLLHPFHTQVDSIMQEDLIYVTSEVDQEEVANIMEKYDLVAIPVVDESKTMIGRITIDDIVDVIQDEAEEDIQKIAGLSEEQESSDSIFRISRIRLPWLIIAFVIEFFGSIVLDSYQDALSLFTTAVVFIPIVMAMGGSSGSQAAIVMVRGLTSGDIWLRNSLKNLRKDFFVALLNGLVLSSLLLLATILFFKETFAIALLVSSSLIIVIIVATMMGSIIPILLRKMNIDPAIATGPFVSTSNDILGLIIYLTIIQIFYPLI
ncbi:MAG: magnesium transporter [Melioribacteraceae bacterium]|nr:magnesium transporter [Melioribacteraceae bacterium]